MLLLHASGWAGTVRESAQEGEKTLAAPRTRTRINVAPVFFISQSDALPTELSHTRASAPSRTHLFFILFLKIFISLPIEISVQAINNNDNKADQPKAGKYPTFSLSLYRLTVVKMLFCSLKKWITRKFTSRVVSK